jgi:hypothetical protein
MKKIGECYLARNMFLDEANKTIGKPIVGPDMVTLIENRRRVTGRVTDEGKAALRRVADEFFIRYGVEVKLVWSANCGCSMCPCSPGFKVMAEEGIKTWWGRRDRDNFEVNVYFDDNGWMDFRPARYGEFSKAAGPSYEVASAFRWAGAVS